MRLVTVNAGSSSVRLAAFDVVDRQVSLRAGVWHSRDEDDPPILLREFLAGIAGRPDVVAHRVVHGGSALVAPCEIDAGVEAEIARLSALAPLHNPVALEWVRGCRAVLGPVPQIAVFDTAFYASLPEAAATYALPFELARRHAVRRYGFHGIAHRAMCQRWRNLRPDLDRGGQVVSFQLGAGASITAIDRGEPTDTSMGFSPIEGLVMATRSGDVDPGILLHLQASEGLGAAEVARILSEESGLRGLSGQSDDMKELLASDSPRARLAVEVYCHRARKYLGAYLNVLSGAHAVLFGGGVGENAPAVRERILRGMDWCGLVLDPAANRTTVGREGMISAPESRIAAWVIPVDEAIVLVEEALRVIAARGGAA